MSEYRVATFFYGSDINIDVLKDIGFVPKEVEPGRLDGFDIVIRPIANLVRSDPHSVYGIIADATHRELEQLYSHARDVLGATYYPEAVLIDLQNEVQKPALCYIAPPIPPQSASGSYIDKIVSAARDFGFPPGYIEKVESFRPGNVAGH